MNPLNFYRLLLELIRLFHLFRGNQKSKELVDALKKARLEKDTSGLERIFNPDRMSDDDDEKKN